MLGPLRNAWWRVKASGTPGSVWERLATFGGVSQGLGASGSAWQRLGRSGSVRKRPEDGYGTVWENALYVKIKGSRFIRKNTYSGPSGNSKINFWGKFWARTKLFTPSLKLPKEKIKEIRDVSFEDPCRRNTTWTCFQTLRIRFGLRKRNSQGAS